jgi:hypothetical protein
MVFFPLTFVIAGSWPFVFLPFGYLPGRGRWRPVTEENVWVPFAVGAPCACLAMAFLVYRWCRIRSMFRTWSEVSGVVVSNEGHQLRTRRVDFEYEYRGQWHVAFGFVLGSSLADSLVKGQTIAVLVDPARPSQALIKTFYASAA